MASGKIEGPDVRSDAEHETTMKDDDETRGGVHQTGDGQSIASQVGFHPGGIGRVDALGGRRHELANDDHRLRSIRERDILTIGTSLSHLSFRWESRWPTVYHGKWPTAANFGEQQAKFRTSEGHRCMVTMQVTDVRRPLHSRAQANKSCSLVSVATLSMWGPDRRLPSTETTMYTNWRPRQRNSRRVPVGRASEDHPGLFSVSPLEDERSQE